MLSLSLAVFCSLSEPSRELGQAKAKRMRKRSTDYEKSAAGKCCFKSIYGRGGIPTTAASPIRLWTPSDVSEVGMIGSVSRSTGSKTRNEKQDRGVSLLPRGSPCFCSAEHLRIGKKENQCHLKSGLQGQQKIFVEICRTDHCSLLITSAARTCRR